MTANNDKYYQDFFDSLDFIHADTSGETTVMSLVPSNFPKVPAPNVKTLIDNGLAADFQVIQTEFHTVATLRVIEPRYTYYCYRHIGRLSNDKYIALLDELTQSTPIDDDSEYIISLNIEQDRYVYLNWESGRLLVHDLGDKNSSRRKQLVLALIRNNRLHTSRELHEVYKIEPFLKGYKDMLTTSFMVGGLRRAFMISSSKSNVGIRSHSSLSGRQLISIIREQLHRTERVNSPHFKAKIKKIDIVKIVHFFKNTKKRQP